MTHTVQYNLHQVPMAEHTGVWYYSDGLIQTATRPKEFVLWGMSAAPPPPPPPPLNTQPKHVRTHRGSECARARGQ